MGQRVKGFAGASVHLWSTLWICQGLKIGPQFSQSPLQDHKHRGPPETTEHRIWATYSRAVPANKNSRKAARFLAVRPFEVNYLLNIILQAQKQQSLKAGYPTLQQPLLTNYFLFLWGLFASLWNWNPDFLPPSWNQLAKAPLLATVFGHQKSRRHRHPPVTSSTPLQGPRKRPAQGSHGDHSSQQPGRCLMSRRESQGSKCRQRQGEGNDQRRL